MSGSYGLPLLRQPVIVPQEMLDLVRAGVNRLWQRIVAADPAADHRPLLLSYDVHPTADGAVLIEVNTNAGGIATALKAAREINPCCPDWEQQILEARLTELFKRDLLGPDADAVGVVAIVDDDLARQPLLPEMRAVAKLLEPHAKAVLVVDAAELRYERGRLRHGAMPVDRIYWRSTDFLASAPAHRAIRHAAEEGSTILAPSPAAYAAIADKRQIVNWSRDPVLASDARRGLSFTVARTVPMQTQPLDYWQAQRAHWVFKPASGYASRGVYLGKSISRQKLSELPAEQYLAQEYTAHPQAEREGRLWKYDLRFYADRGTVIAAAARVFQGQVMGMRADGNGFAPVKIGKNCCLAQALAKAA